MDSSFFVYSWNHIGDYNCILMRLRLVNLNLREPRWTMTPSSDSFHSPVKAISLWATEVFSRVQEHIPSSGGGGGGTERSLSSHLRATEEHPEELKVPRVEGWFCSGISFEESRVKLYAKEPGKFFRMKVRSFDNEYTARSLRSRWKFSFYP